MNVIDDGPMVENPAKLSKHEPEDKGCKGIIVLFALDEDVTAGTKTDDETNDDANERIKIRCDDSDSKGTEENSDWTSAMIVSLRGLIMTSQIA